MFGVVPAAMIRDRAGSSKSDPSVVRRSRTAESFPKLSGMASRGSTFSMNEMPSSSALTTSSWFRR